MKFLFYPVLTVFLISISCYKFDESKYLPEPAGSQAVWLGVDILNYTNNNAEYEMRLLILNKEEEYPYLVKQSLDFYNSDTINTQITEFVFTDTIPQQNASIALLLSVNNLKHSGYFLNNFSPENELLISFYSSDFNDVGNLHVLNNSKFESSFNTSLKEEFYETGNFEGSPTLYQALNRLIDEVDLNANYQNKNIVVYGYDNDIHDEFTWDIIHKAREKNIKISFIWKRNSYSDFTWENKDWIFIAEATGGFIAYAKLEGLATVYKNLEKIVNNQLMFYKIKAYYYDNESFDGYILSNSCWIKQKVDVPYEPYLNFEINQRLIYPLRFFNYK